MRAPLAPLIAALTAANINAGSPPWVEFSDQTESRLIAEPAVGADDTMQKAYAWADLDLDGDTDLIAVRKGPFVSNVLATNVLFLNEDGVLIDRTAQLASASDLQGDNGFLTPTADEDVTIADVNNDGLPDVITAPYTVNDNADAPKAITHPRIYINLGFDNDSAWLGLQHQDQRIPQLAVNDPRFYAVAAGDLNNDGAVDLVFTDGDLDIVGLAQNDLGDVVLINDGQGVFSDQTDATLAPNATFPSTGTSTDIADLNNDGLPDIIRTHSFNGPGSLDITLNSPGNPGLLATLNTVTPTVAPAFVCTGDLNNDGLLDLVLTDDFEDRYFINQGPDPDGDPVLSSFPFTYTADGDFGFGGDSVIADLDNDGHNDVIITDVDFALPGCGRRARIFRNTADADPAQLLVEYVENDTVAGIPTSLLAGAHDAAVFDINNDGFLDIVLGQCTGTRVFTNIPFPTIDFVVLSDIPPILPPNQENTYLVRFEPNTGSLVPGSETVIIATSLPGKKVPFPMTPTGQPNEFEFTLPNVPCGTQVAFTFVGVLDTDQGMITATSQTTSLATAGEILLETDGLNAGAPDWTIESDGAITAGVWELAEPIAAFTTDGQQAAPGDDAEQGDGGLAFITQNGGALAGQSDVDNGSTSLVTPLLDAPDIKTRVEFYRWMFSNDEDPNDGADFLVTELSPDDGNTWLFVDQINSTVNPETGQTEWLFTSIKVSQVVETPAQVRLRFTVADAPNNSITEAGIDVLSVMTPNCTCDGDLTGEGDIDSQDLNILIASFDLTDEGDINGDSITDSFDLNILLDLFGTTCF